MDWRRVLYGRPTETRALDRATAAPLLLGAREGERVSVDRALGLADVFACVRVLAESAASLPLHVYRRTDDGRERVTGGGLRSLIERPAPAVTTASLVGALVGHLTLHGNAFVGKYRDPGGVIEQLGLLDPARVQVKIEAGAPVYELATDKGMRRHGPADVLHVRAPLSVDGIIGLAPIRVVREALTLADALAVHARTFAQNAGRPSGVLKIAGHASVDQAEHLKASFTARHGGPTRAGGIAVIEGDLDFTPLSVPLADAQFVEQRQLSTAEVARVFRVPPWMIGAPAGDSLTYANTEQQAAAFVTFSLRPWLVAIEQALSADADLAPGALYVEFVLDALLRGDSKTRAEVYRLALDPVTGWMSRPEVRGLENLPAETTLGASSAEQRAGVVA